MANAAKRDIDLNIVRPGFATGDVHGLQGLVTCIRTKSFYIHRISPFEIKKSELVSALGKGCQEGQTRCDQQ